MTEDEFSGEKSVLRPEPTAADYEPAVRFFRSLAAVGLVYGTAGALLLPYGLLRFHQGAIPGDFRVFIMDETTSSLSPDGLWLFVASILGAGLAFVLVIGVLGALRLKSWCFPLLWLWGVASILLSAGGTYFYVRWLFSPVRDELAEVRGVDDTLTNLGGWIVGTVLAVLILIVINRKPVRCALRRNGRIEQQ